MNLSRKDWLKTFLALADGAKPAMEYRKRLGIRFPDLAAHVASIGKYRDELLEIERQESNELFAEIVTCSQYHQLPLASG